MTYRLQMEGEGRRLERERNERMAAVWHTEALQRAKKLPGLSEFLGVKPKVRKQSPAEAKAIFAAMRR